MVITVNEALRLKTEIAGKVQRFQYKTSEISWGTTTENGQAVNQNGESQLSLFQYVDKLEQLFSYSHEINSVLARFNVESGISDLVREKSNVEFIMNLLENNGIQQSKASTRSSYQVVGDSRVLVTSVFTPTHTKQEIKAEAAKLAARKREILAKIDTLNARTITLSFSQEDVDKFSD